MSILIPESIPGTRFLDSAATMIESGDDIPAAFMMVCQELYETRRSLSAAEWRQFATVTSREHSLHTLLAQDPLTARIRQAAWLRWRRCHA